MYRLPSFLLGPEPSPLAEADLCRHPCGVPCCLGSTLLYSAQPGLTDNCNMRKALKILIPPFAGFVLAYVFNSILDHFYPPSADDQDTPGIIFLILFVVNLILIIIAMLVQTFFILPRSGSPDGISKLIYRGEIVIAVISLLILLPLSYMVPDLTLRAAAKSSAYTFTVLSLLWTGDLLTLKMLSKKDGHET